MQRAKWCFPLRTPSPSLGLSAPPLLPASRMPPNTVSRLPQTFKWKSCVDLPLPEERHHSCLLAAGWKEKRTRWEIQRWTPRNFNWLFSFLGKKKSFGPVEVIKFKQPRRSSHLPIYNILFSALANTVYGKPWSLYLGLHLTRQPYTVIERTMCGMRTVGFPPLEL